MKGTQRLYFRREADHEDGRIGVAYLEVTDGWPSRQVEVYGSEWIWADEEHNEHLADQPLEVLEMEPSHEIEPEAFEKAWSEAIRRSPRE